MRIVKTNILKTLFYNFYNGKKINLHFKSGINEKRWSKIKTLNFRPDISIG